MPSTKQHRWAVPNAAKKEQSRLRKLAKAEAQRQSMIRFHALRLIHDAKPAFGPQTNGGSPRLVPVDLRIWASVEQGRGHHILARLLFGSELGWGGGPYSNCLQIEDHTGEPTLICVGNAVA